MFRRGAIASQPSWHHPWLRQTYYCSVPGVVVWIVGESRRRSRPVDSGGGGTGVEVELRAGEAFM